MANGVTKVFTGLAFYAYAFFNLFSFIFVLMINGVWFRKDTEQDKLQYAIAKDQFWNLAKSPIPNFCHNFYTLRNNLKLHYISNREGPFNGNLVIFFHGFPDSCVMWRHLLQEKSIPLQDATLVAVDLPGFGGSDSFPKYDTQILDALSEFVVAMRDTYIPVEQADSIDTLIVGHDWGCILGFRLAAEAPALADRFILTNAPHTQLALANVKGIVQSSSMIFKQFRRSPWKQWSCLSKAYNTIKPLLVQVYMMGYIFIFNLSTLYVNFLGIGGNYAFMRSVTMSAYDLKSPEWSFPECLATSFGPGKEELDTAIPSTSSTSPGETYGASVIARAKSHGQAFWNMTGYYRHGVSSRPWTKSLETIADLYALESSASESSSPGSRRRASISNGALFAVPHKGALKAPTYVLWGEKDQACSREICLNGLGDYLAKDSEVTILPRTSHWTPIQKESRAVLARVIGLFARSNSTPLPNMTAEVHKIYPDATLYVKK
ncbi:hypothetical protein B0A52_03519 [Exophiala mesophila]|uniref:AB hydrolase-1 domain-containing protein n=1 Tax=Exophiala mesophila TaxID=212818 RepID=A0A438N5W0_EXOME|nr:hypothetical protein B0A52_03519 [Exophiala mesophila]